MRKKGDNFGCDLMRRLRFLLFLVLFQVVLTDSQNQTCNSADLVALQGLLRGLHSGIAGWSINASSSDCCKWDGVFCDDTTPSEKRVIGLDLHNKSLKGFVTDSLADLDRLRLLNLSCNLLEGTVPSGIFNLSQLQSLDLSMNKFSGTIPPDLFLPSIVVFNVSDNSLGGRHPVLAGSTQLKTFDISFNEFSGGIDAAICSSSAGIIVLRFSMNSFGGEFPLGFGNCSSLEELSVDFSGISGNLPDDLFKLSSLRRLSFQENHLYGLLSSGVGNLSNLQMLDLSFNSFSGNIPDVFSRLTKLNYLSLQSNNFSGPLPYSLSNLSPLRLLNMKSNLLSGEITINCMVMNRLNSLDLGTNFFSGSIPYNLSHCVGLKTLSLARNNLTGEIPDSFKNLTLLSYLSLSNNSLSNIYSALMILQQVQNLTGLVLTMNFQDSEMIPTDGIHGFQNLQLLAIANCGLFGSIPPWLSNLTKLNVLDLSWNHLQGAVPSWIGHLDNLFYLDLSNNSLSGEIPDSLTHMKSLIFGSTSQVGPPTEDPFPFFVRKNISSKGLQYNQVSSFPPSLLLSHNMLVGSISPGFGNLKKLHVLDLSRNFLSGSIPDELSGMSDLESMDLSYNNLSGNIPLSFSKLNFLSSFRVAYNNLSGPIPVGVQFSTFSSSDFEGNPGLCGIHLKPCGPSGNQVTHAGRSRKNKGVIVGLASGIGFGASLLLAFIYFLVSRTHHSRQEEALKVAADSNGDLEAAESRLVLLFNNMNNSSELSIGDILTSTNHFDQSNIIGCGGFGLVYKGTLPDERKVAIKRLSGDYFQMEREFQAEIETLSRAQHQNLVLLQGYCKIGSDRLLIYSYMQNGSLDYWLHEKPDGGSILDWMKRLRIAQGAARGLAYLHQSCDPHILHRDIKSSNILLDENFEAHLADFGLARLIFPYDTHVTTDLVGTLGYIPPEYGQSSVATFKGDIYSFGVVLLELLTGKRPVDMCKPKGGRELISWVLQMKKEKREPEVFDPHIYDKSLIFQLMKVLEIACVCLSDSPRLRPLTKQLVTWLDSVGADDHLPK